MKNHLFTITIFLFFFNYSNSNAQNLSIEAGVGLNLNTVVNTRGNFDFFTGAIEETSYKVRAGYYANAGVRLNPRKKINFSAQLQYSQEEYLRILGVNEIMVRHYFLRAISQYEFKISEFAGIFTGLSIGGKLYGENRLAGTTWIRNEENNLFRRQRFFDFGVPLGLRIYLDKIILNASYTWGLTSISHGEFFGSDLQFFSSTREKNRAFQIGIGYLLYQNWE